MAEKKMQDVARPAREAYDKGLAAFHKNNWDYAIALFEQALKQEPGFYDCREALRAAQFKKVGSDTGLFRRFLGAAGNSPMLAKAQLSLRSNPTEAIATLESTLNSDPNNLTAHRLLAEAAMNANLPRTAALSLEIVQRQNPRDKEITLRLGAALAAAGEIRKAEALLTTLAEANPNDAEVAMALKDLSAKRSLGEGGYERLGEDSATFREALKDKHASAVLEQESRVVKADDIAGQLIVEYSARLAEEPDNPRLLRSLAELHAQRLEFDAALDYFRRLSERQGSTDPSIEKSIAETQLRRFDHLLSRENPAEPEGAARIAQLRKERADFELADCRRRAEAYPTDLSIKYDLGVLLLNCGRISEAIQEFQKAQANPHRRVASLQQLARCFSKRNMHDLAVRTLENAIREKEVFDEEKKSLIYDLGCALEKMKKPAESIEQFKLIYEVDASYRDVGARVDAYYTSLESVDGTP